MTLETMTQRRKAALERVESQRAKKESMDILSEWVKVTAQTPEWQRYPYRDRIPDPLLEYADWFVRETHIEPDGRTIKGWLRELSYWQDKQLDIIDLENAWAKSGEGTQFMVTSPFSLTNVAVAMKAKSERREEKYNPSKSVYACPICGEITCTCGDD